MLKKGFKTQPDHLLGSLSFSQNHKTCAVSAEFWLWVVAETVCVEQRRPFSFPHEWKCRESMEFVANPSFFFYMGIFFV